MSHRKMQQSPTISENAEDSDPDNKISPMIEYFKYTKNTCMVVILILLLVFSQILSTGSDYWVAFW